MAFAIPLIAGGTAAGATGTAVATAASLTKASTLLSAIGGATTLVAGQQQARFAQAMALRNAQIAEDNAKQAKERAAAEAQEADVAARGELGALLSEAGASGLNLNQGSVAGRRRSLEQLAAKDRGFIVAGGEAEAFRERQRAEDYRAEGRQARSAGSFRAVGDVLGIGSTLISGAARVNRLRARQYIGDFA